MTEQPLLQPPDQPPDPVPVTPKASRRDLAPWLYGVGFLILAVALFYIWQYPGVPVQNPDEASARQAVEQQLTELGARLTRLEQRPSPDLGQITARVDNLDGKIADQTQLGSRLDALSGRIESLSARDQTGLDANKQQLDALTGRIAASESNAGSLAAVTKRLGRIAKLQEMSFALASGRPIGDVPDAPQALARYAHAAPPTEAQMRLRFSHAEQAALAADPPNETDGPLMGRVWERAQGLITIRRGDDVVVGNSSATTISRARAALEAGDLATAVAAVDSLKGQPAQAMAAWLADAKALLDARSALADMAEKA